MKIQYYIYILSVFFIGCKNERAPIAAPEDKGQKDKPIVQEENGQEGSSGACLVDPSQFKKIETKKSQTFNLADRDRTIPSKNSIEEYRDEVIIPQPDRAFDHQYEVTTTYNNGHYITINNKGPNKIYMIQITWLPMSYTEPFLTVHFPQGVTSYTTPKPFNFYGVPYLKIDIFDESSTDLFDTRVILTKLSTP